MQPASGKFDGRLGARVSALSQGLILLRFEQKSMPEIPYYLFGVTHLYCG
jgi:hypothetical protein